MKRRFIILILISAVVFAMAGAGTMAWFTSQATSNGNTFKTGTLTLGGVIDGRDVNNKFAKVTFDNMEPGEPPEKIQTTELKNVGSLPFYLYRITASDLVDNTLNNEKDDTILDEVLIINITIGGEHVYSGRLSQLVEENGGYFDPIYSIEPGDTKEMVITAYMDPNAGNEYQGLSMKCDLTVYATQSETPIQGEEETWYDLNQGDVTNFNVRGRNYQGILRDYVQFDWDWEPNDDDFEYYEIMIKHETGDPNAEITEKRWSIIKWKESIVVHDMITGEEIDLDSHDVIFNVFEDRISINRDIFPSNWKGIEVKLSGTQFEDPNNPGYPDENRIQSLPIQYWSFDK